MSRPVSRANYYGIRIGTLSAKSVRRIKAIKAQLLLLAGDWANADPMVGEDIDRSIEQLEQRIAEGLDYLREPIE